MNGKLWLARRAMLWMLGRLVLSHTEALEAVAVWVEQGDTRAPAALRRLADELER